MSTIGNGINKERHKGFVLGVQIKSMMAILSALNVGASIIAGLQHAGTDLLKLESVFLAGVIIMLVGVDCVMLAKIGGG